MLTKFVDVKGVATRCIMAGDAKAPAMLLIHGVSLTSEVWVRNIDELARDYRVIAVDMLGHGFTRPRDGRPVGITEKIEHLRDLLDALSIERAIVSGSSYGALMGANLYLKHPERVATLIINGSGSAFNSEEQLAVFTRRIYENYKPTLAESTPEMWRERLKGTFHDPRSIPCELVSILPTCYAQRWAVECWEETINTMRTPEKFRPFRILDRLEQLQVRSLVVWGKNDKGGVYESAVAAVKRMPRAELIAFDDCAHLPMLEHPGPYNAAVRKFLA